MKLVHSQDQQQETHSGSVPDDAHDRSLLKRITARDHAALEVLYTQYHRRLARFLTRLTYRYELAEEIINDTLLLVWQRADEFRGASRVSTWIIGIAYRRALATLRHVSVRPGVMGIDEPAEPIDPATEIEQRQLLDRALATLPLEQRLVLELTYFLGHSCEEIAEITDCPVNTVKTRMFHARRKLRQLLPGLSGEI
jgi:RNA polymerase sigma-70 factor (ECF subfamily)